MDGDQSHATLQRTADLADNAIDGYIKQMTGMKIDSFDWHADSGKEEEHRLREKKSFIDYAFRQVKYFPLTIPEEIIIEWSSVNMEKHKTGGNSKGIFKSMASHEFGETSATAIEYAIKKALKEQRLKMPKCVQEIQTVLHGIING